MFNSKRGLLIFEKGDDQIAIEEETTLKMIFDKKTGDSRLSKTGRLKT